MKKTIALLALALAPSMAAAQSTPPEKQTRTMMDMSHEENSGWKELDDFHAQVAATWHPATMSNDLKPARTKAAAMSTAADAWFASSIPTACDTKEIRDARTVVVSGSKAFEQLVLKNATDAELKSALKSLHSTFEVVEKKCKPTAKMP